MGRNRGAYYSCVRKSHSSSGPVLRMRHQQMADVHAETTRPPTGATSGSWAPTGQLDAPRRLQLQHPPQGVGSRRLWALLATAGGMSSTGAGPTQVPWSYRLARPYIQGTSGQPRVSRSEPKPELKGPTRPDSILPPPSRLPGAAILSHLIPSLG
ncbi:hypothetical protein FDECE_13375 [Fusarium decemcellulare]|nr:hypothetical protein FDECE_13375 [Fusarium decemcellulare]